MHWLLGTFALAYILGSIPFGLLLTRAAGLGDLRTIGSGNIGATNVMRTGRKWLGMLTLLCDGAKGFAAVWLARYIYADDFATIAGLFAVLGHVFPIWLGFKGGKGVATTIGVLLALSWPLGIAVCFMWLAVFGLTRTSSISSMAGIGYSPIIAYLLDSDIAALLCLSLAALIIFTHRGNIKRLLQGTENNFSRSAS